MAVLSAPGSQENRVLLQNICWSTYEALLEDIGPHPGKRITYDRGLLEIMTTSPRHERIKTVIRRLLEAMTLELGIRIIGVGSATWKRKDLQRGLEPDECYYIGNEEVVRGRDDIDLPRDPPPDLLVEVDISRSSLKRHAIHAAFGVAEVWRFDGDKVRFEKLQPNGDYRETEKSAAFPFLAAADLNRFLAMRGSLDDTSLMQTFREWGRKALRGSGGSS
jgi:Uma2 family endonuclease